MNKIVKYLTVLSIFAIALTGCGYLGEPGYQADYTLFVHIDGNGTITRSPEQENYVSGATVEISAMPDSEWQFSRWTGDASGSTNPLLLTLDGDKTVGAVFTQNTYNLTVTTSGSGTVTRTPDIVNFTYGTSVELTATPDSEWQFSRWTGDASGSTNPLLLTLDGDKTVGAVFAPNTCCLTITTSGSGTVTRTPDQESYAYGVSVELSATPDSGWQFGYWTGDASGSLNPLSITFDDNKDIGAVFIEVESPPPYPDEVLAFGISDSIIYIAWAAVTGADGYRVYSSAFASGPFYLAYEGADTEVLHSGLPSSTVVYYRFSAYSDVGEGGASPIYYASTLASVPSYWGGSIYGSDGQFLGIINNNSFDSQSIANSFGTYGNRFSSFSIWNEFGTYGSQFGSLSAYNSFAYSPPAIYVGGVFYAYITTNTIKYPRINPNDVAALIGRTDVIR